METASHLTCGIEALDGPICLAFRTIGLAYLVIVSVACLFIRKAPADYKPKGWAQSAQAAKSQPTNRNWTDMVKTPTFYLIITMLFVGAFSGLMIASQASGIATNMFGLSASTAALYVSLYSLSNSSGRFIWGAVSDKIGRTKTLSIIFSVVTLSLLILATLPGQASFAAGIIGLGICFGGVMGVFPSLVMENYGPANQGINYGIVFTGYSLAAFFAPRLAAQIGQANQGNFAQAFYIAIALSLAGLVLNLLYAAHKKKA